MSYYTGMLTFAGITFGAFEIVVMQFGFWRIDAIVLLGLSFAAFIFLVGLKSILGISTNPKVRLYALDRPYGHLLADYAYFCSVAATLTTFVYIWTRNLPLFNNGVDIPEPTRVLILNLFVFALSMGAYSVYAKRERAKIEGR